MNPGLRPQKTNTNRLLKMSGSARRSAMPTKSAFATKSEDSLRLEHRFLAVCLHPGPEAVWEKSLE